LEADDVVVVDHRVIATKIITNYLEITTRITIARRIPAFWGHSKNQCTLENSEEDEEFDEVVLM